MSTTAQQASSVVRYLDSLVQRELLTPREAKISPTCKRRRNKVPPIRCGPKRKYAAKRVLAAVLAAERAGLKYGTIAREARKRQLPPDVVSRAHCDERFRASLEADVARNNKPA